MKESAKIEQYTHQPVLLNEVVQGMSLSDKEIVVDCTLGLGGHTEAFLKNLPSQGRVIAFELDPKNLQEAQKRLDAESGRIVFVNKNFSQLQEEIKKLNIQSVDAVFADLGLSSVHVDDPERGFSFMRTGPLDMRFDRTQELTAADVLHRYSEKQLASIFKQYGEEPQARKVASEIVKRRKDHPFQTTSDLADFLEKLLSRSRHAHKSRIHPATRVFQAIRMEVNHELDVLQSLLQQAVSLLTPGGILAVISYHSLEDRVVKNFFRSQSKTFINLPNELTTTVLQPTLKILTKKPIVPSEEELKQNPRSRSAKLRIAQKI